MFISLVLPVCSISKTSQMHVHTVPTVYIENPDGNLDKSSY